MERILRMLSEPVSSALALAPLVLAQMPAVSANELGQWLLAAAAAAVIANPGMAFFRGVTDAFARKRAPRNEDSPTIEECNKRHTALDSRLVETSALFIARIEQLRLEMKDDNQRVHNRVDEVVRGVARIEGAISNDRR
jgi:hypothetical protein